MVVTHLNGSDRWSIGAVAQMGLLLLFVDIKCGSSGEDSPRVLFVLPNGRIILNGGRLGMRWKHARRIALSTSSDWLGVYLEVTNLFCGKLVVH